MSRSTVAMVFINGRFLSQTITGVQRYAIELVKTIDRQIDLGLIDAKAYSFEILAPKNIRHSLPLKHIKIKKVGLLRGPAWGQLELPFHARGRLLLNMCNVAPMLKRKQIVTIHDAAVVSMPFAISPVFRIWYKILGFWLGKIAKYIIAVSEFSKDEISRHYRINRGKIRVVYLGSEHVTRLKADDAILGKHDLNDKSFILSVGSMHPAKNFRAVIAAVELLDDPSVRLVIAGGINPKVFRDASLPISDRVTYAGYVDDRELKALYCRASCFVFPSFYEGFGLPPLEAMAAGCPVIVSLTASLPEVCGDVALYCDPHSPEDIAAKIRQLINDLTLQELLRNKGLERAKKFTWEKCAQKTLRVIEEVLSR